MINSDYESLNGDDLEELGLGTNDVEHPQPQSIEDSTGDFASPEEKPELDQQFESSTDFEAYMHRYAYANVFAVRNKGRDNPSIKYKRDRPAVKKNRGENDPMNYIRIRMVCTRAGKPNVNGKDPGKKVKSSFCDCKMRVVAYRQSDGWWKVTTVYLVHNHPTTPESVRFMNRYRGISEADENHMLLCQRTGLRASQIYNILVIQYHGIAKVPFSDKDMRNILNKKSLLEMQEGDFRAMERFFMRMKAKSPDFFYTYDIDEYGRVKSIFWTDGRGRKAFQDFGHVISFDTTYMSNRYKMPFAPFIGVNHHGQSILFGCALIAKDDAENFSWLFRVWLTCMRKAPKCILTDQCRAIAKAVADVFPETRHRWCIWHILRNLRKNFGSMNEWANIAKSLRRILHESLSIEEFEAEWFAWADKFGILGKTWCINMYNDRQRWVPIYFKSEFWARMSSTQRSEDLNNFFKGFVNVNTTLQVFVEQYALALAKRMEDEVRANHDSLHSPYLCMTEFGFEGIFQALYTNQKFGEFQKQLRDMMYCNAMLIQDNDRGVVYKVKTTKVRKGRTSKRAYLVRVQRAPWDISCECKNFEFRGILCCHMIQVFKVEEQQELPQKFIVDHWRKDLCREYTKVTCAYSDLLNRTPEPKKRYDTMEELFQRISSRSMMDGESFKKIIEGLTKLDTELNTDDGLPPGLTRNDAGNIVKMWGAATRNGKKDGDGCLPEEGPRDPVDQRKRGRARSHRVGYEMDKKIEKKKRKRTTKKAACPEGNDDFFDLNV